jgi:hypothetical protein
MISINDLKLIKSAFETDEWNDIEALTKQAENEETKQILHDRAVHLYRKEEAFAGQL